MKRSMKDMDRAIRIAEKQGLDKRLSRMYGNLPEGTCGGCTTCCSESVPAFFIEFVNIWRYMKAHPEVFQDRMPRVLSFYHTELAERRKCPFLGHDNRCTIYEVRPLTCRLFGFSRQEDHEANLKQILQANRQAKKDVWNAYRIDVPDEVVSFHIPFCESFEPEWQLTEDDKMDFADTLFGLDSMFLMSGLLDEEDINQTLIPWFVHLLDDPEDALDMRIKISGELIDKGESITLKNAEMAWRKRFSNKMI